MPAPRAAARIEVPEGTSTCRPSIVTLTLPMTPDADPLPGVRNGAGLACLNAGKGRPMDRRLARIALVLDLLFLVQGHHRHRLFPHGIVGILVHHDKHLGRAGLHTVPTTIALFRINGDEILP